MDSAGPGGALKLIGRACELIRDLPKVIWKARELVYKRVQLIQECFGALLSGPGCILHGFATIYTDLQGFRNVLGGL